MAGVRVDGDCDGGELRATGGGCCALQISKRRIGVAKSRRDDWQPSVISMERRRRGSAIWSNGILSWLSWLTEQIFSEMRAEFKKAGFFASNAGWALPSQKGGAYVFMANDLPLLLGWSYTSRIRI